MVARRIAVLLMALAFGGTAGAVVPKPSPLRPAAETLTAMPAALVATAGKPLRTHARFVDGARPSVAWTNFVARAGGVWVASYDAATGVPNRIYGSGIAVPGSSASPAIAEYAARQLLADHLALVAPGANPQDFELVSNHWDGEMRSIGFVQKLGGLRVLGGQVSFRFKNDRLFVIGSEALPNVKLPAQKAVRLAPAQLEARATTNLRGELVLPNAPVATAGAEVIVPLVSDSAVLAYRVGVPMEIDGGAEGRYLAYVEPSTGEVLAVRQQNMYATGTIQFRGVDRHPGRGRIDRVAPRVRVKLDGADQTTTQAGGVSWMGEGNKTATLTVKGDLVAIINKLNPDAETVTTQMALTPNGSVVWDATAVEEEDAQLITYLGTNIVKEFVRQNIDPNLAKLDETMLANVNIQQNCNAYFDGQSINFFKSSSECENTGRLEDVIYHEYGHNLHVFEIIEGVGSFDGAMSEGVSDFLAASITNDSGMGRGFFKDDDPLRELNPVDRENMYPRDIAGIHTTGIIYGGTFWDLRTTLMEQLGPEAGQALVLKLYTATLRRSTSIPSSLVEALAADDDDGDLANGTPHECQIRDAYGKHGMRTANGSIAAPTLLDVNALATTVRVNVTGLSRCAGDRVASASLSWRPSFTEMPPPGSVEATRTGEASFYGQIPLALDESVMYRASIVFEDTSELVLANNLADPYYQLYQGDTRALYCTNFDTNPFEEGWTTGGQDSAVSDWEWGVPAGTGATDPPSAFTGTHALVQGLGKDYANEARTWVALPEIDVGRYSDVRLQYRRWLATEDSYYDEAKIITNANRAWMNASAHKGDDSSLHHIDREWRFHDVALSGFFSGNLLNVRFDLASDAGLAMGGWAIDDLCIVANTKAICGDGVKTPTEVCDDGVNNADEPNRCRTYCRLPTCGDAITDDSEECDAGPDGNASCNKMCEAIELPLEGGCGCQSSGDAGPLGFGLAALVGGLVLRRRRR